MPIIFYKALMYVTIPEPNNLELYNLTRVIITSYHSWDLDFVNNKSEGKIIFTQNDEVDDELYDPLLQMNYSDICMNINYSDR